MTETASMARSDGSMAGALRTLASLGPLHEQNLLLISIEAIRAELGERWEVKRDSVWAQVEKFLRHQFGVEDLVLRLDELNALVVQPGRTRVAAQTRCIQAACDLIRFFLGEGVNALGSVKTVVDITGGQITAKPVPPEQIAAVAAARDVERWAPCATVRCPILTPIGRSLFVEVSLAPILILQPGRHAGGFAGYAVQAAITDAQSGLALDTQARSTLRSCDLASVDVLVTTTAFAQRAKTPQPGASLVVPISSHTLAHSSARYALLDAIHRLSSGERNTLALEIVDLEPGMPVGRLCDLVATARPHCRGVVCRMDATAANAEKAKAAGATLSDLLAQEPSSESYLLNQAMAFGAAAKLANALMLHNVAPELAPLAAVAGVTHCTFAGERPAAASARLRAT